MKKVNRGEFGYIASKKRRSLGATLLMVLLGVAVFLVGYFLNDHSNRNVFTIIAVLFVLPGARFLVAFIVVFKYRSVSRERYDAIKSILPEGMTLYTDLVITSAEKVMSLDFVAVGNMQVIGLIGPKEKELSYIRTYVTKGVNDWSEGYKVKILDNEKNFMSELKRVEACQVNEEQESNVRSYFTALIV